MDYREPTSQRDWNPHDLGSFEHQRFESDRARFGAGSDGVAMAGGSAGALMLILTLGASLLFFHWFYTKTKVGRWYGRFQLNLLVGFASLFVALWVVCGVLSYVFIAGYVLFFQ